MVASHMYSGNAGSQYNVVLQGVLLKLNGVLEEELSALNEARHSSLEEYARKKISLFSQLRVLDKQYGQTALTPESIEEVKNLKSKLTANLQKLELQMNAMKELNRTIEQAVLKDQSDGTYTVGDTAMNGYV